MYSRLCFITFALRFRITAHRTAKSSTIRYNMNLRSPATKHLPHFSLLLVERPLETRMKLNRLLAWLDQCQCNRVFPLQLLLLLPASWTCKPKAVMSDASRQEPLLLLLLSLTAPWRSRPEGPVVKTSHEKRSAAPPRSAREMRGSKDKSHLCFPSGTPAGRPAAGGGGGGADEATRKKCGRIFRTTEAAVAASLPLYPQPA